jgi:hypothetical protein
MEANSKDIEWLLENATQYMISKETNVPQSKISRLKNGKIKMENLTFEVASILTDFSKKLQKKLLTIYIILYIISM